MLTKDFDYHLPAELIAQEPALERSRSRLMLVHRATGAISHYHANDLPSLLQKGDQMVLNDTRVIPARLFGKKTKTGGKVEVLFIEESEKNTWQAFLHSSGRPKVGDSFLLAGDKVEARLISISERGRVMLELHCTGDFLKILANEGLPPLPPYIKRPRIDGAASACSRQRQLDLKRYQTVYARVPGAVAAPTAGLHLSNKLLNTLAKAGIERTEVTLHVGPGTFIPVRCEKVEDHKMESERLFIPGPSARKINKAIAEKRRIVAVGTTTVRTLESAVSAEGKITAGNDRTEIFIYPPFHFQIVGALLTNFHLPCSTLLMMVSAFAGRDLILRAYETAIREKYRFYSYGDCMLII